MASNPPAQCCAVGVKDSGKPSGTYETVGGYPAYVVKSATANGKAVLLLPDVLGHEFPNAQLIADSFAENGYTTIIPDLFHGDPVKFPSPPGFDFMSWMTKGTDNKGSHLPERVDPVVEAVITAIRSELGITRLAAAGYCFGAKYVVRFLKPGQIDVGYLAHPSFVQPEELKAIKGPVSIAAAETDDIFPAPKRHESEVILASHSDKVPYQINLYSGTAHGFSVRGDTSVPQIAYAKKAAFLQAVQWFQEHL
ncbi:Alpha/Beta hydrolase protein [Podospora appendiculata]|uniref:Alpha/Beta hydrolase protein n=1 Tax=Podospora appendiculata TaxID=314037 RepID=A0AAE1C9L8_9PEZI|nr:Alpha/Beta hydrolase protein [Podospora appendiculata]